MKTALTLQQFKKCIISFIVGIACSTLAYVIYVVDPVRVIMEYNMQMRPNSFIFTLWKKPPLDVYINVYVFNLTNPVEFLNGKEKLKIQEIGPYVYQEILENINITFNDNGTLTFMPNRKIVFIPEMSISDPIEDFVHVPNVPLLGISSTLHDAGFLVNYPLTRLANMLDSKPILNISVYDYLWGYEDTMVTLASGILPNFINFKKFGLMDRMYDEGENIVTMHVQKNVDMKNEKGRYFSIDKYNGSPGLAQWGYIDTEDNKTREKNTVCNTLQGATESLLFPPNLDKSAVFRLFRKAFCRPLPIIFRKEVETYGLSGYYYTLKDDFADPAELNPDNKCYCRNNICLKKGLMDLTPCYYKIPAAVSLPHFLNADPSLLEDIDGLSPSMEKHKSYLIVQPTLGIPLYAHSRMQTNLVMQHTRYNSKITPFNGKVIPLFWFDVSFTKMPTSLLIIIKLVVQILPIAQIMLTCLLGIVGVTAIAWSLGNTLKLIKEQRQKQQEVPGHVESDIKMPLYNGQHASISILPTISKITSTTDLFS